MFHWFGATFLGANSRSSSSTRVHISGAHRAARGNRLFSGQAGSSRSGLDLLPRLELPSENTVSTQGPLRAKALSPGGSENPAFGLEMESQPREPSSRPCSPLTQPLGSYSLVSVPHGTAGTLRSTLATKATCCCSCTYSWPSAPRAWLLPWEGPHLERGRSWGVLGPRWDELEVGPQSQTPLTSTPSSRASRATSQIQRCAQVLLPVRLGRVRTTANRTEHPPGNSRDLPSVLFLPNY